MDKGELQEVIATLYMRLNGYFTSGHVALFAGHVAVHHNKGVNEGIPDGNFGSV